MKKNQIKSILHDILEFMNYRSPLPMIHFKGKLKFDLISGKTDYNEDDSLTDILKEKRRWFLERVDNFGGELKDFNMAEIIIEGNKEIVKIIYKKEEYSKSIIWKPMFSFGKDKS
jgi:hypothetical protein